MSKEPIIVNSEQYAEIERLHKSAESRVISSPTKYVLLGLGAFGLLVNPLGAPAAIAVSLPFAYAAIKRAVQNGENAAYMKNTGIFAHLLSERELVKLTRLVGREIVTAQLQEALEDDKPLSSAALDYLEYAGVGTEPIDLRTLLQGKQPKHIEAIPAIDVPAVNASESLAPTNQSSVESVSKKSIEQTLVDGLSYTRTSLQSVLSGGNAQPRRYDVREVAASGYVESILWVGASQSGKTTTADQLGRQYRRDYGDRLQAFYITPVFRADGANDERRLFDWCDRILRLPLLNETDPYTIAAAYEQFESLLDDFLALKSDRQHPKLFVADELTLHHAAATGNKHTGGGNPSAQRFFGKLIQVINANASGGKAAGIAIWGISPTGAVGGIGLTQYSMSACLPIFIADLGTWNGGVFEGAKANKLAPQKAPSAELKSYCDRHRIPRVISVGCADWHPLMEYEIPRLTQDYQPPKAAISTAAVSVESHSRSVFDELATEYDRSNSLPLMSDFIRYLKGRANSGSVQIDNMRELIKNWGSKKERGVTTQEQIEPFFTEALRLGLLVETDGSYRVVQL